MKKPLIAITALLLMISLCACSYTQDPALASLGKHTDKQMYTEGGFQDFTDYGIYKYNKINLEGNKYFKPVTETALEDIEGYIQDFEKWVEIFDKNGELAKNYDFNLDAVNESWYFYIDNEFAAEGKDSQWYYANYNVYLLDAENKTLYYFHNNI